MPSTHLKIIYGGSSVEVFNYQDHPILYGYKNKPTNAYKEKVIGTSEEQKAKKIASRKSSMHRSQAQLKRLVNMNAWNWKKVGGLPYLPVFVTLTFKENIKDVYTANRIFSNFIKRLNYSITKRKVTFLKYVVVTEYQDLNRDGVIHYHAVFFNLEHIWKDTLCNIWGHGFVDIKQIKNVKNIGAYISKYMSKHFEDDRLDGKKRYFSSRGLFKPTIIKDEKKASTILKLIPDKYISEQSEFDAKEQGHIKTRNYKLDRGQTLIDVIPDLNNLI